jgi:hypothetical protein
LKIGCFENRGKIMSNKDFPRSPFAKYIGELELGNTKIDCYVLDTGDRVISYTTSARSITQTSSGDLTDYIGANYLKPYISEDLVLDETIE